MRKIIMLGLVAIMFSSCATLYVGSKYTQCPTNNKSFFYNRMGVKPSKQFLKWGNQ
jgi:hypothetical protein